MTAPDGPHFPLRLQPSHAEQGKTAVAYQQREGDGPAFDQEWTREDMQDAREAFGTIAGKSETWRTVWLTPDQFDALISAVVEYELGANPSGDEWGEFYSEIRHWWDADPVEGDISEEQFWDGLADLADTYQGWTVQGDGPFYAALQLDNAGTGTLTVSKNSDGLHEVNTEIYSGSGEEIFSATTAHHHHRHAVLRDLRLWFDHAAANAPLWVADPVDPEDEQEMDNEGRTTTDVEFGSKAAADNAREEWAEYRCSIDDDKRLKTVTWASDTPSDVLETIRNAADEGLAESQQSSVTADLSEADRDKIKAADGFGKKTTVYSWESAKGVFEREGLTDQFRDAIGSLTDYDDPAEGAEAYVRENKQADAEQGTQSVSGGRRDHGHEEEQTRRKMEEAAAKAQQQGCEHGRDLCENGDPDACEFLQESCGYDEDEVERLLSDNRQDVRADETEQDELVTVGGDGRYPEMDVTPGEAGALRDSWSGYRSATGQLKEAVETVREEVVHARQAWRAIQSIRANHGQEEEHPNRLHDSLEALEGLPEDIPEVLTLDHFARGDHETEDGDEFQGAELEGIDKPGHEIAEGLPDLEGDQDQGEHVDTGQSIGTTGTPGERTDAVDAIEGGAAGPPDPETMTDEMGALREALWSTGEGDRPNDPREWPGVTDAELHPTSAHLMMRLEGEAETLSITYDSVSYRWQVTHAQPHDHQRKVDQATEAVLLAEQAASRIDSGRPAFEDQGETVDVEQPLATSPAPGAERVDLMDRDAGGRSIAPLPEEVGIYELKRGLGVDTPGEIGGATYTTGAAVPYPVVRIQPVGTGNGWAARAFEEVGQRDTDAQNLTDTETAPEAKAAAVGFMQGQGDTVDVSQSMGASRDTPGEQRRPWLPGERFEEYGPTSESDPARAQRNARGVSPAGQLDDAAGIGRDRRLADRGRPNERDHHREMMGASMAPEWDLATVRDMALGTDKAAKAAVQAFDSWEEFAQKLSGHLAAGRSVDRFGSRVRGLGGTASRHLSNGLTPDTAARVMEIGDHPEAAERYRQRVQERRDSSGLDTFEDGEYSRHVDTSQSIGARPMSEGAVGDHRTSEQKAKREQARREFESRDVAEDQGTFDGFGSGGQQSRLAGGEMGERGQGTVEETTEENPGGLMADERDVDTSSDPTETEQGGLEDVGVTEGLRDADQPGFDEFEETDE